jgi:peptidyl-prolyl cis-trans isomerase A (cyclophilin A)
MIKPMTGFLTVAAALLLICGCEKQAPTTPTDTSTTTEAAETKPANDADKPEANTAEEDKPMTQTEKPADADSAEMHPRVVLSTTKGDIVLELDPEKAPITVKNFLQYVDDGHYNGTIFHRVMDEFMIQGGGFGTDKKQKESRAQIKNEWQNGLKNKRGTIAMARLGNQPDSASAQFFINHVDNDGLDLPRDGAGYAVFGKVVDGMDVVDAIAKVTTGTAVLESLRQVGDQKVLESMPAQNVPIEDVIIESAKRVK